MSNRGEHLAILRLRLFLTTVVLSIAILLSFGLAAYSFKTAHDASRQSRVTLCRAENEGRDAITKVLLLAQSVVAEDRSIPPDRRRRDKDFYTRALVLVQSLPCGKLVKGG